MSTDALKTPFESDMVINFASNDAIEFEGKTFTPDDTKGYFMFSMCHTFPARLVWGTALHPAVVAASYKTLIDQQLNWEHLLQIYHKKPGERTSVTDRFIGHVAAAGFPPKPINGWRIPADKSATPGITGVACFYKQAQGIKTIVGEHQTGRHRYTVSMETEYDMSTSGFAAALNNAAPKFGFSPPDFLDAGYEYIPWDKAPQDLRDTFSKAKNKIVKDWGKRQVSLLMGGLDTPVHLAGMAVVRYGAEPTAKIMRMSASGALPPAAPFQNLAEILKKTLDTSLSI